MKKRITALILAAMLLATAFTGCGGDKNTSTATTDEATISTTAQSAYDETTPTVDEEIKEVIADEGLKVDENGEVTDSDGNKLKKSDDGTVTVKTADGETVKVNTEAIKAINNSSNNTSSKASTNTKESTSPTKASASNKAATQKSSNKSTTSKTTSSNKPSTVAVSSVSLSKNSMRIKVGVNGTFTVNINPSNATNTSYTATTSNGNATVSCSGSTVTVKGVKEGSTTVTVKSNNGKTATCSVIVMAAPKANNNSSSATTATKPAVITDDTVLTHEQLCTDKYMQKYVDAVIEHLKSKGATYAPTDTLKYTTNINGVEYPAGTVIPSTIDYCGWWFAADTTMNKYEEISYNEFKLNGLNFVDVQIEAYWINDGYSWNDLSFNCYYEKQSDGEYYVYLCYF